MLSAVANVSVARAAATAAPAMGAMIARKMSTQLLADKYKAIKDTEPNFLECFKVWCVCKTKNESSTHPFSKLE